ncbi:hypothetical protein R4544_14630 [Acinetobacter baumannii]|nr:hypothetical protein [Acinetobacter baumannii]
MKLIIKDYLASLKERNELDALIPTLLSQMGLTILSSPSIGNRQYGVDISAFGSLNGEPEKVYLFTIKAGNLGRQDWDNGSFQDVRPSLNEILDTYIPTHIPAELSEFPIEICATFGGDLKQEIELTLSQFEKQKETKNIKFSRWSGDRIAGYLESYLFNEQLFLTDELKSLLRKSLAMVDQPEVSFKNFSVLIKKLFENLEDKNIKNQLTIIRQSYLALGILNSWCNSENNIESAYLSAERLILYSWEIIKLSISKRSNDANKIKEIFKSLTLLYLSISETYYKKLVPHLSSLHAISNAIRGNCDVDINIKLFDVIGRIALFGIWLNWCFNRMKDHSPTEELLNNALETYNEICVSIKKLIINNPLLFHPFKDDQAIDISLTAYYLLQRDNNDNDLLGWLSGITHIINTAFLYNRRYPSTINDYMELVHHPIDDSDSYREGVTKGSILYPLLAFFSYILKDEEMYTTIREIIEKYTPKCTSQIWHPDADSETHFYKNSALHGLCLTGITYENFDSTFNQIKVNCKLDKDIAELSAIKYDHFPIILTACRHYRLPFPYHFFFQTLNIDIFTEQEENR